jgi:hypothetical protein
MLAALDARPVHGAVDDELHGSEHLALLTDDAPSVRARDVDVNVRALCVRSLQPHVTVHSHLLDHVASEGERFTAPFVRVE